MRHRRLLVLAAISAAFAGGACSSSSTTTINTSCTTKYSATINGSSWCAFSTLANYYPNQQQVVITGSGFVGNSTTVGWNVTLSVSSLTAAGTYNLTTQTPLRYALAASGTNGYTTLGAGGSGTITFTTFTTSHVVGTFSFTAPPNAGSTGTATVSNGSFDVTVIPAS